MHRAAPLWNRPVDTIGTDVLACAVGSKRSWMLLITLKIAKTRVSRRPTNLLANADEVIE
jgi:hypothetical protein